MLVAGMLENVCHDDPLREVRQLLVKLPFRILVAVVVEIKYEFICKEAKI